MVDVANSETDWVQAHYNCSVWETEHPFDLVILDYCDVDAQE